MEQIYRAFDGTIFEDEDDCLYYERMLKYADNTSLLFADSDGKYISMESLLNHEEGLENISFIICKSHEGYEQLCALFDDFGISSPKAWGDINDNETPRCWFWNESGYRYSDWESLYSVLEEAERLKRIFENLAEKG